MTYAAASTPVGSLRVEAVPKTLRNQFKSSCTATDITMRDAVLVLMDGFPSFAAQCQQAGLSPLEALSTLLKSEVSSAAPAASTAHAA